MNHDRSDEHTGAGVHRVLLGLVLPMAAVVAFLAPPLIYRAELPDRLATHYDGSGTPDGSMTMTGLILFMGMLVGLGVALMVVAALMGRSATRPGSARPVRSLGDPGTAAYRTAAAGLGGFLAGLGAAIMIDTVWSQRGLDDWTEASFGFLRLLIVLVGALAVAIAATALGRALGRHDPVEIIDDVTPVPALELADGERAVFVENLSPRWALWAGAGLLAMTAVMIVAVGWRVALFMIPALVVVAVFSTVQVSADRSGLTVRSGLFGVPYAKIDSAEIERVSVIDVEPMKWGGWGYRGSLKVLGQAAVVTRRGPGVRLDLTGDRTFVVTLDGAPAAASLLAAGPAA